MQVIIQDITKKNLILTKAVRYEREQSLFYIQRKIYQASEECNDLMIHSLQKLLISLKSIRELAIDTARLYNKSCVAKHQMHNIDEIMTFWCLEAEWLPKFKRHQVSRKKYFYLSKWSFHSSLNITSLQNIDQRYLLAKLQSISWIKNIVHKYLDLQYFVQERISTPSVFKNIISFKIVELLHTILVLGIDWTYYQQNLKKRIHHNIMHEHIIDEVYVFDSRDRYDLANHNIVEQFFYNSSILKQQFLQQDHLGQFIVRIKNQYIHDCVEEIMISLKTLLYRKDYLGRYRINYRRRSKIDAINVIRTLDMIFVYHRVLKQYIHITKIINNISKRLEIWTKKQIELSNSSIINQLYRY